MAAHRYTIQPCQDIDIPVALIVTAQEKAYLITPNGQNLRTSMRSRAISNWKGRDQLTQFSHTVPVEHMMGLKVAGMRRADK